MKVMPRLVIFLLILAGAVFAKDEAEISLTTAEPFKYIAVEMTGSYEQHNKAFETLTMQVDEQGIQVNDVPFGIYFDNPMDTPMDQLKWDVGFPVADDVTVSGPLVLKDWEHTTMVTGTYEGIFGNEDYNQFMGKLWGWVQQNGYQVAGPMMEKFLTIPEEAEGGNWKGKAEFYLPVVKK